MAPRPILSALSKELQLTWSVESRQASSQQSTVARQMANYERQLLACLLTVKHLL